MSSTPIYSPMIFERNWDGEGGNYQVWESPLGYVVPFKDFQKYIQELTKTIDHFQRLVAEKNQEIIDLNSNMQRNMHYITERCIEERRTPQNEANMFKIAFAISVIVIIILVIALIAI